MIQVICEKVEGKKNRFNFIITEQIFLKLCIPLSITHTNSGKEIRFFLLLNKKLSDQLHVKKCIESLKSYA